MKKLLKLCHVALIVFLSLIVVIVISSNIRGYTSFANFTVVEVQTNSMNASGIYKGDVYLIYSESNYEVSDIVAVKINNRIVFHEIIEISEQTVTTKGSSNYTADPSVDKSQIIGKKCSGNLKFFNSKQFRIFLIICIYIIYMSLILEAAGNLIKSNDSSSQPKKKKGKKPKSLSKIKSFNLIFLLVLAFGIPSVQVFAINSELNSFTFQTQISFVKDYTSQYFSTNNSGNIIGYDNESQEQHIVVPTTTTEGQTTTSINSGIFNYNDYVQIIEIPSTITQIGWLNFMSCPQLEAIVLYASNPITSWTSYLGWQLSSSVHIYVPDEAISTYKQASGWSKFKNQIVPLSSYEGNLYGN